MIGPRWRKVLADLWHNKLRTLLVISSIAVGTFAVGVIAGFGVVVEREMNADFLSANPHSAVITSAPFDDDLLQVIRRLPGVAHAEGRSTLAARVEGQSGEWHAAQIVAIPSLGEMQIDRLLPVEGGESLPLGNRQVLVERTGMALVSVQPGDTLRIELPDQRARELQVAGSVRDATRVSSLLSGQVTLYVTLEGMERLGGARDYSQMISTVSEKPGDEAHVRTVARTIADRIEDSGRPVFQVSVSRPGKPPMDFVLQALLVVEGSMVAFLVVLSTFLVINTVTALLSQQERQIGVMKAIGAHTPQVMGMYIALVLGFGIPALAVAVPLSTAAVYGSVGLAGEMMNFAPGVFRLPPGVVLLQAAVALGMPVLAALFPVINGSRITIREAISSYGLSTGKFSRNPLDSALERIRLISRPTLLSLRNTFRRKGRLILTLSTLALGGALFIAVFNLRASFTHTLKDALGYYPADVNVTLARPYRVRRIEQIVSAIPEIERVEGWSVAAGQVLSEDKTNGQGVLIYAPPSDSTLIQPAMAAGRWLHPADENAIVVCNQLTRRRSDIQIGGEIVVDIQGQEHIWQVVGICTMPGDVEPGVAYANYDYLARTLGEVEQAADFHIVTSSQGSQTQDRVARGLEEQFGQAGITVANITTGNDLRAQQAFGVDIFINFMLLLAGLVALVGGLGLAGTMSMNVLERTREIGVMRAIGASDGDILQLVIVEGLTLGAVSWLLGTALSLPISKLLADGVGLAFLAVPLPLMFSLDGFLIWLAGAIALSALSSFLPARNASRLTIRKALAYE